MTGLSAVCLPGTIGPALFVCLPFLLSVIVLMTDTQAQLEKLQNEIAQAAKKTGIASAAKLATIQPKKDIVSSCWLNLKFVQSKFVYHFLKIEVFLGYITVLPM